MQDGTENERLTSESRPIPGLTEEESKKAAELIQRTYRGHKRRRELNGFGLNASTRWDEVRHVLAITELTYGLRQSKMLDTN